MVVVCIALGAILMTISNIAFWPAHVAFQWPVLLMAALGFATSGRPGHLVIAVSAVGLCIGLSLTTRKLGEAIVRSMFLAAENEVMAQELAQRGQALEQANLDLARLSHTDSLTGIANRRAFKERLEQEWLRAKRTGTMLSLLAIDVDHFKLYNDKHGHVAGDECLQFVAGILAGSSRQAVDFAARPGGEEFALILPATSLPDAETIAQRLIQLVADKTASADSCLAGPVTISVGVATINPNDGTVASALIEKADKALYEAKNAGRNCAMLAA